MPGSDVYSSNHFWFRSTQTYSVPSSHPRRRSKRSTRRPCRRPPALQKPAPHTEKLPLQPGFAAFFVAHFLSSWILVSRNPDIGLKSLLASVDWPKVPSFLVATKVVTQLRSFERRGSSPYLSGCKVFAEAANPSETDACFRSWVQPTSSGAADFGTSASSAL